MTDFRAPIDDILFSLRHVARADRLPDWDDDLAREVIGHFARFAQDRIAPLDAPGDRQGCRLEGGRVRMPDGFAGVYADLAAQGWQGLTIPERFGGQGLSPLLQAAVSEIFTGANHSLQMVCSLAAGAAGVILRHGSAEQQARLLPPLASGQWVSTMALTEPVAGSDLAAIRTRAERDGAGWRISGEKIFISGGDQDLTPGILHLVLARSGAEPGVRGLSLFACGSHLADGARSGVSVTRIEEKMGLHAQPTCQLAFDGAAAELIGQEGQGLAAMFAMMNHARIDVGLQGVAHAARAADLARSYAASRVQGRGADGRPVTIDQHADVAAMIAECDRLAIGARALCHIVLVAEVAGDRPDFVEFMTPVVKVLGTEAGIRAADLAIDVMGGYGYLREYRAEQNWRDARICTIYEGTNGIHARATAGRALAQNGGAGARAFADFLRDSGVDAGRWQAEAAHVAGQAGAARAFMRLTCDLALRAALLRVSAAGVEAGGAPPLPARRPGPRDLGLNALLPEA